MMMFMQVAATRAATCIWMIADFSLIKSFSRIKIRLKQKIFAFFRVLLRQYSPRRRYKLAG